MFKVLKFFLDLGINGLESNVIFSEPAHTTSGENIHRKIHGHSAGMKKVERPKVQGATGKVNAARSVGNNGSGRRQCYSVKKWAIWRNLL